MLLYEDYVNETYVVPPNNIGIRLGELYEKGSHLDSNPFLFEDIKTKYLGYWHERHLVEVTYPDNTIVLFYKSRYGTSGKEQGGWYPIGGFISESNGWLPKGWLIKNSDVYQAYGSRSLAQTTFYLTAHEVELLKDQVNFHDSN